VNSLKNVDDLILLLENEVKKVKSGDRVCLIHHDDADGCTSAAIFSILIFRLTNQFPELLPVRGPNNLSRNFLSKLKMMNPDFVFTLDVTIDPKKLSLFNGFILDHHMQNIPSRENMIYINPRSFENEDEKVPCTSCIIYKLVKKIFPEEKISWIAAIGVTEDHRVEICKEIFLNVNKEYPGFFKAEKIDQENVEKSIFGELWDMVRSGRMIKRTSGAKIAVQALIECKDDPNKFVNGLTTNSYTLRKFYEAINKETQKILEEVLRNGKFYDDKRVIVYEARMSNINSLTSFASDKLRQKYPDWIVCVVGREYGTQNKKISIRLEQSRRNVNLVEVVNKIKEVIPEVKGGGHKSAVGVSLPKNSLNKFFKLFLTFV
jgi:single-stranded DNA-specific DHH superfamily exonuclease